MMDAAAGDDTGERAFTLIQISDLHLSKRRPFFQHNFEVLRDVLVATAADCILCTGDMSLDGAHHPDELAFACRQLERLGREILFVPGNHDIGNSLPDVRGGEITISAERASAFRAQFGSDYWMKDIGASRLLGLNSMLPGSGLHEEAEQEALLAHAIDTLGQRRLIVAAHKPLYLAAPEETARTQSAMFPEHRHRWAELLHAANGATYLCGHLHELKEQQWRAVRQVWAPSTAFVMDAANRFARHDRPNREPGIKRPGLLRHTFRGDRHVVEFIEPTAFLIVDLGNWYTDPRGFHSRYADEPWRGCPLDQVE
ncbi:metallophosphoesterase family protein [Bradyrhizobium oligotrophicum]|uniref:metallophosphoesterase family protein n=1 Tax=Bradyrhizobium oligotrophicum TaxID=44255 RepID=UPI003EBFD736